MNWFYELTGFRETQPEEVRGKIQLNGETLISRVNGRKLVCGRLETLQLSELRARAADTQENGGRLRVTEIVADAQQLHADIPHAGALFQVASQFNLLEMISPNVTPEDGVGRYENDHTQGPACAISAGAGTIYRNYFASVNGKTGQTAGNQIDCLADLGKAFGNANGRLWEMRNGYALATRKGLEEISERLHACTVAEMDQLRGLLRIGLQWNTQVTLPGCSHLVSQAYCSALPVSHGVFPTEQWESFASLVLEAAYEATLWAALINARITGSQKVFLTLLGGGVFGNPTAWILDALRLALPIFGNFDLDVNLVSYRVSNPQVRDLANQFNGWRSK